MATMARSTLTKAKPRRTLRKPSGNGSSAIRTYRASVNYLDSLTDYEKTSSFGYNSTNFNLTRMNRLLAALDNPHKRLRTVHVAGTKGKGSTATMLACMLEGSGYRVGLYTSPHILDIRERIAVCREMISEAAFARAVGAVATAVTKSKLAPPTFFEAITAAAFLHFVAAEVDIAVIETGLGGRLDSTNVIKPEVCCITNISFDHVAQLGGTLSAIAEEKAGIMKPGVPVISAPQEPEVKAVLRRAAEKAKAPLYFAGEDIEFSYRFESSRQLGPHNRICLTTPTSRFEHLHVPALGDHQAINCGLALAAADALKKRGLVIDDQRAVEGLANVRLPGRMEILREEPRILADGAHNAASIDALMRAIGQSIRYDSMVVIFACHKDKDVRGMLRRIQLGADKIIFTSTGTARSVDPVELAALYGELSGKMVQTAPTLDEAMSIAERAVTREDLICITGSFYLVAQAKRMFPQSGAASGSRGRKDLAPLAALAH